MKQEEVRTALEGVIDPELGINIVDLGLVYEIELEEEKVKIEMTLTSPGCPLVEVIEEMVREAVAEVEGVEEVDLQIIWDPLWTPDHMSEEAKAELGFD